MTFLAEPKFVSIFRYRSTRVLKTSCLNSLNDKNIEEETLTCSNMEKREWKREGERQSEWVWVKERERE